MAESHLNQKVMGVGDALASFISWSTRLLGRKWAPNPMYTLNGERGNPDRFLETGSEVVIPNDGLPE